MTKVLMRAELARARMDALGLSQDALAASLGVGLRTVQRWLAGQRLQLDMAERVAMQLELGTSEVFIDVPQAGLADKLARVRLIGRMIRARDGSFAQLAKLLHQHGTQRLDLLLLRQHPAHGFVRRLNLEAMPLHRFVRLRVRPSAKHGLLQIFARMTLTTLLERAWMTFDDDGVWIVETLYIRSMRAACAPDGSFELWYWASVETEELVFASTVDFQVVHSPCAEPARDLLDLSLHREAVCVRPLFAHLVAAGLPMGFDRVRPRDEERIDIPVPSQLVALREGLWTTTTRQRGEVSEGGNWRRQ